MEVLCQCGCGESFEFSHLRPHRKYWNHNCATRADRRRQKAAGTLKRYPRATGDEWGHEKEFILGLGRGIHTRVVLATREQLLRGYLRGLETRDPAPGWKGEAHDLVTQILENEFGAKGAIDTLPKLADLKGIAPGLTGGLSSEEYIRKMRESDG